MKLNIINLIDNFNKFNNYAINPNPTSSQGQSQGGTYYWIKFLNNSQNCLIFEKKPTAAIKLFKILLENGNKGIVITRCHPDKLCSTLIPNQIDTYWLSTEDFDYVIHPWDIRLILQTVNDFINKNNQSVILLNGLEYLSTYNNTKIIIKLISDLTKIVANANAKFFITMDPIAIGNQFLATIENNSEINTLPSHPIKEVLA